MDEKVQSHLQAILEGEIRIMKTLDSLVDKCNAITTRMSLLEQRLGKIERNVADDLTISNNALSEIEDFKGDLNNVADKLDNVAVSVDNIRIYQSVSNFEV